MGHDSQETLGDLCRWRAEGMERGPGLSARPAGDEFTLFRPEYDSLLYRKKCRVKEDHVSNFLAYASDWMI
jgi:hypothetical protein